MAYNTLTQLPNVIDSIVLSYCNPYKDVYNNLVEAFSSILKKDTPIQYKKKYQKILGTLDNSFFIFSTHNLAGRVLYRLINVQCKFEYLYDSILIEKKRLLLMFERSRHYNNYEEYNFIKARECIRDMQSVSEEHNAYDSDDSD